MGEGVGGRAEIFLAKLLYGTLNSLITTLSFLPHSHKQRW